MQIVGVETRSGDGPHVHTIDLWFSERRRRWVVERLDQDGAQLGPAHYCASEAEAEACLAEWLRHHCDTHLVAPRRASAAEARIVSAAARRAA